MFGFALFDRSKFIILSVSKSDIECGVHNVDPIFLQNWTASENNNDVA